jgi:hypothetical protein
MIEEYGKLLEAGAEEFRAAEAELASRWFRFPDRFSKLVKQAQKSLSELGRLVNEGKFDAADLQLARFEDDYHQIAKDGRGWRLADPFEGIRRRFRKAKPEIKQSKYELSEKEMQGVMDLVFRRATTQAANTFAVHPPKKLLDRPEIAQAENVIEELDNSVFEVVFQDGTAKMLTLPELMVFIYNLIELSMRATEVFRMMQNVPHAEAQVKLSITMSMEEIMRPEMVRVLLSKIEFSNEPSDAEPVRKSA